MCTSCGSPWLGDGLLLLLELSDLVTNTKYVQHILTRRGDARSGCVIL